MPVLSRDDVEIGAQGTKVVALQEGTAKEANKDYVWLTKQGIYEQIKVSDSATSAGDVWVNTSSKSDETKNAAQQIANNIGENVTVGEKEYAVTVTNDDNRDLILAEVDAQGEIIVDEQGQIAGQTYEIEINSQGQTVIDTGAAEKTVIEVVEAQPDKSDIETGATLFAGGTGTQKDPFIISSNEHLLNIGTGLETGATAYYILANDLTLTDESRVFDDDYAYYNIVEDNTQDIHLNLNKHSISNINGCIFDRLYHIEAYNGKLVFNANTKDASLVEVIRHTDEGATAYFHDLSIEGTALVNEDHWGPLVCYMYGCYTNASTISADKILVNLTVKNTCNDSYSGGLFGYIQGSKISASITNCQVNGSIQGPYAFGFFNGCCYPNAAKVVNSGNVLYGSLLGSKGVGIFGLNGNYNPAGDTPELQDALVTNNGHMATVSSTTTLINNYDNLAIGDKLIINNTDSNVDYVIVSIVYWTNRASDGTGGYPNNIDVRIEIDGESESFDSGLYKNRIVQSSTKHSGDILVDESYRQIWRDGDKYMVYQEDAVFSSSKTQIHVYAYSSNGTMLTYQSMEYNSK